MNTGIPFAAVGNEAIFFLVADISSNGHERVNLYQKVEIVPDKNGDGKNLVVPEPDESSSGENMYVELFKMATSVILKKKMVGVGVPLRISGSIFARENTYRVFAPTDLVVVAG